MSSGTSIADVVPIHDASTNANRLRAAVDHTASHGLGRSLERTIGRTVTDTGTFVSNRLGSTVGAIGDAIGEAATAGVRAASRRLTSEPTHATDDWGCDPVLVRNMMMLAQLRWDVSTGGDQHLPKRAGALVVVNSPRFMLAPIFTAFAISEAIDRPVRFVGRSDTDVLGALGRRIGGLLDDPDEIAGALRSDEIVVLGAAPGRATRGVGVVDHALVGAAVATRVRTFPAAASSSPFGRRARVEIGRATRPPRRRRGSLTELELADRLRVDIGDLLAEMGDIGTGTPLDWLPLSGLGAH